MYIFFFPKLNIYQILHFSSYDFQGFYCHSKTNEKECFTCSFILFCNKYLWSDYTFDSVRLGLGQPILFEKNERESRLCNPLSYGLHLLMALQNQNKPKNPQTKSSAALPLQSLPLGSSWSTQGPEGWKILQPP